jgi:membrane-bound lytic murein transglycosylase D
MTAARCVRWAVLTAAVLAALAAPAGARAEASSRSGSEIYARFREHLAEPDCAPDASARWRQHFAAAPGRMASSRDDVMPLFGYVVDALIESDLPTEFALIPFVESGYRPGAKSAGGPAGLWQMIGLTARKHGIPMRPGYDGRLSPVDSTRAAVRYLKTLYGMFAGDWRLAAMAYNAGENRILGALRRSGQEARSVDIDKLGGVPAITRAYVRKLHALACVLDEADDGAQWRAAIDRQVPLLTDISVPAGTTLDSWAERNGLDVAALRRMNPALGHGRMGNGHKVLAPGRPGSRATRAFWPEGEAVFDVAPGSAPASASAGGRTHTVRRGESASRIAARYRVRTLQLLQRNGLDERSVLQPGMILKID